MKFVNSWQVVAVALAVLLGSGEEAWAGKPYRVGRGTTALLKQQSSSEAVTFQSVPEQVRLGATKMLQTLEAVDAEQDLLGQWRDNKAAEIARVQAKIAKGKTQVKSGPFNSEKMNATDRLSQLLGEHSVLDARLRESEVPVKATTENMLADHGLTITKTAGPRSFDDVVAASRSKTPLTLTLQVDQVAARRASGLRVGLPVMSEVTIDVTDRDVAMAKGMVVGISGKSIPEAKAFLQAQKVNIKQRLNHALPEVALGAGTSRSLGGVIAQHHEVKMALAGLKKLEKDGYDGDAVVTVQGMGTIGLKPKFVPVVQKEEPKPVMPAPQSIEKIVEARLEPAPVVPTTKRTLRSRTAFALGALRRKFLTLNKHLAAVSKKLENRNSNLSDEEIAILQAEKARLEELQETYKGQGVFKRSTQRFGKAVKRSLRFKQKSDEGPASGHGNEE